MHDLLVQQIEWIVALQQHQTPLLNAFFETYTHFGGRYYLWLLPVLIWAVDYRTGTRVLALFAVTLFLNTALKEWGEQPRPFQLDERIFSPGEEGYGLPSGHAQLVVVFWGVIALWVDRGWFWAVAIVVMLSMGFSRVYLGVHFPTDVLGGFVLGGLTVWGYLRWQTAIEDQLASLSNPVAWAIGVGGALFVFDRVLVGDEHYFTAGVAGLLAGLGIGASLASLRLDFTGQGVWWRRGLRVLVGMTLTLGGLAAMQRLGVPAGFLGSAVVAIDLVLMGVWLTFAAPWLFSRIGLGSPADAVS